MLCALCGENNSPDSTLCRRCGQKLAGKEQLPGTPIAHVGDMMAAASSTVKPFKRVSLRKQQISPSTKSSSANLPEVPGPLPAGSPDQPGSQASFPTRPSWSGTTNDENGVRHHLQKSQPGATGSPPHMKMVSDTISQKSSPNSPSSLSPATPRSVRRNMLARLSEKMPVPRRPTIAQEQSGSQAPDMSSEVLREQWGMQGSGMSLQAPVVREQSATYTTDAQPSNQTATPEAPVSALGQNIAIPEVPMPAVGQNIAIPQAPASTPEQDEERRGWTEADLAAYRVQLIVPVQHTPPINEPIASLSAGSSPGHQDHRQGAAGSDAEEVSPLSSDTGVMLLANLGNLSEHLRDIYEVGERTTSGNLQQQQRRARKPFVIFSMTFVILALLGSIGFWIFQSNHTDQAAITQRLDTMNGTQFHCVTGGSANAHDLACWTVNVDLTLAGAASGHVTGKADCVVFLDVDNSNQPDQHIDCAMENTFTLTSKQYQLSWYIHHYINPGNYGAKGEVNASLPQLQSQPLLLWNGNTNATENSATVNDDKMSGTLNLRLIQSNTDAGVTPSAVMITGNWTLVANTCKDAHSLHYCG